MIASLPMYDRPETAAANDRLWNLMRDGLPDAPKALIRNANPWDHWRSESLYFSQTCGLPFRMGLHERLHLIASPDHRLDGCAPGFYRSALVARHDDPRDATVAFDGARLAFNSADSQSGWAAPQAHAAVHDITFSPGPVSGAHVASAHLVADGQADIAALDAVTWAQMQRWDAAAARLRVIDWTEPTPALPFVTARPDLVAPLRTALAYAIEQLDATDRERLHLFGLARIPAQDYLAIPLPTEPEA